MPASAPDRGEAVRAAFREQGRLCAEFGSPLTARVCAFLADDLTRATALGRAVLDWPGDPNGWADGLPLRLCGGLHALVRNGRATALATHYVPHSKKHDDAFRAALAEAVAVQGVHLLPWLERPPQTNEVGRGAALMAGLLVVAKRFGLPIALLELGASAGLNLQLDRYAFDLGGVPAGDPASPLHLRPQWKGPPPPRADVRIATRRGVDLRPVDPVRDAERLLAFVWADQPARLQQLERALALAADDPLPVDPGDAADWLEASLPIAPQPGQARVVMHSIAWQYFPPCTQAAIAARIEAAGETATAQGPLAWLRFEKDPGQPEITLRLRAWPDGEDRLLATCHTHGRWVRWLGQD